MANLDLSTVELVSTLRAAPLNGSPSSQDYNDSWTESLADLASLAGFIDDIVIPMLNGLISTIQPNPSGAPLGIEGRFIYSDTTDTTQVFYNNLSNTSLSIADSLRVLAGIVSTTQTTLNSMNVEITALQTALSSTNQNDVSQALQNFAAALQALQAQVVANTQAIAAISVTFLTNGVANGTQNILNLVNGANIGIASGVGGAVTITSLPAGATGAIQGNNAGALAGIPGTSADYINGFVAIHPTNPGNVSGVGSLSITGDSQEDDILDLYQNGTPGSPIFAIDAFGDVLMGPGAGLYLDQTGNKIFDLSFSPGTSGQVLSSNGSGVLWVTPSYGGIPGSPVGSIQGNHAGAFAGIPGTTADFTNGQIHIAPPNPTPSSVTAVTITGDAEGNDILDIYSEFYDGATTLRLYIDSNGDLGLGAGASLNLTNALGIIDSFSSMGTNGQVLSVDVIGGTNYLKWVDQSGGGGGVSSLNTLTGALTLESTDSSVTITPSGTTINLQAAPTVALKTNGTTNSTQTLLNLANGPGTTVSESGGTVTVSVTYFNIGLFAAGVSVDSQIYFRNQLGISIKFPAGAAASSAIANTPATGSTTITFRQNGTAFATATFPISGTTAAWTQASDAIFSASDVLEIDAPPLADTTLANIGITLVGIRQ
jgi:hypothetical protein